VSGEPRRVSVCHCLACQQRTGSVFGAQARFDADQVTVTGSAQQYVRVSDEGDEQRAFSFCPECGATVYYTDSSTPTMLAIPVGAFADPSFPPPTISVWESRKHDWVALPHDIQHRP
jgi:hypothetical protein